MRRSAFRSAFALALLATTAASAQSAQSAQSTQSAQRLQYSSAHRDSEQTIPQTLPTTVSNAKLKAKLTASRTGTALVVADFDSDGTPDLISAYSTPAGGVLLLQRGSPLAQAPGPNEQAMRAAGQFVTPYRAKSEVIDLPVSPDLLVTADIVGRGLPGLLAAAKGDTTVYALFGHGDGTFSTPQALALSGTVTALSSWRSQAGETYVVAGVCSSTCGLQFLDKDGVTKAFIRTPAAVTQIVSGHIDNGSVLDLAYVSNSRAIVLDGDTALSDSPVTEKLPIPNIVAVAAGNFVTDRRGILQLAVLDSGATLHVFTRDGLDTTTGHTGKMLARGRYEISAEDIAAGKQKRTGLPWSEVETVSNIGSGGSDVTLLRAHLLTGGNDDLAVLGGSQYITIGHRLSVENGRNVTTPLVTVDSTSSPVAAAAPARVTTDNRAGIVTLAANGGARPLAVAVPASYHTYTVNTTTDGNHALTTAGLCTSSTACTLRDAVNLCNNDQVYNTGHGTIDTVNIPAGTYTFSVYNPKLNTTTAAPLDTLGSVNYHLELDAPANLVGAGQGVTIINANGLDQAFAIDYSTYYANGDINYLAFVVMDSFFSNMTIQNARNPNVENSTNCQTSGNFCQFSGGAIYNSLRQVSYSTFNNVTITGSQDSTYGSGSSGGGAIYAFQENTDSATPDSGPLELDNSIVSNNTSHNSHGGGISTDIHLPLVLNNTTVSSNSATPTNSGLGGGISFYPQDTTSVATVTNSVISGNSVATGGEGGGLWAFGSANVTGTKFTGNSAGFYGGGLYMSPATYTDSVTSSTFTGNRLTDTTAAQTGSPFAQDGAGICIEPGQQGATATIAIQYNRFYGNTVAVSGEATGLAVGCNSTTSGTAANVTATNNWWGCNGAATGTGCDTAHNGNVQTSTLTLSPYTTLTLTLNPTSTSVGSPITAIASLGQNSAATPAIYTAAQDAAYLATPISTFTLTNVGTVTYYPSSTGFSSSAVSPSVSSAAATATANGATSGTGTATVTVDGATVTRTYQVVPPAILSTTTTNNGPFKQGSTGNTYTITVGNIGSTSTNGTVTVTDTLPSGFTATGFSGTGWTCTTSPLSCNRSDSLASSVTFPALTLTVSVSASDVGTYVNTATASGGSEVSNGSDVSHNTTYVVAPPVISEAFSPTNISTGSTSVATFTIANGTGNTVTIAGVAFTDTLPTGLKVANPNGASTTCTSGTVTAAAGGSSIALSGASIAASASCTVSVTVTASIPNSYTNTTGTVTSTTTNPGNTASATLTVADTTTTTVSLGATTGTVGGTTTGSVTVSDTTNPGSYNNGSVTVSNTVNGTTTIIGTYTFSGPGTANFTYNESYGGSNVVTAVFTPGDPSLAASADSTGKTIVVAKATPTAPSGASDQAIPRNVASIFTFVFSYPGKIPPSGAFTVALNGSTLAVSPVCVYKTTGIAPHANCTFTYTTALAAGQYPFTYTVAADSNYNTITGTSTINVTP